MSFENDNSKAQFSEYYHSKVEIKEYNVNTDGKNFFDQPMNNDIKTFENIRKIGTGQGDDYTPVGLLDCPYIKENYKIIAIDLRKQLAFDAHPRAMQYINFTANLDR